MQQWAVTGYTVVAVGLPTGDEFIIDGRTSRCPTNRQLAASRCGRGCLRRRWLRPRVSRPPPDRRRERCPHGRSFRSCASVDTGYLIEPESITFPTGDGSVVLTASIPTIRPAHVGPDGDHPPLLVLAHGGPVRPVVSCSSASCTGPTAGLRWSTSTTGVPPGTAARIVVPSTASGDRRRRMPSLRRGHLAGGATSILIGS